LLLDYSHTHTYTHTNTLLTQAHEHTHTHTCLANSLHAMASAVVLIVCRGGECIQNQPIVFACISMYGSLSMKLCHAHNARVRHNACTAAHTTLANVLVA
jgi:hypothetical protein